MSGTKNGGTPQTLYYEVTEEAWTMVQREVFKAENVITKWLSDTLGPVNGVLQFTPKSVPQMQREVDPILRTGQGQC